MLSVQRRRDENVCVLVNIHEFSFSFHGDTFADMLLLYDHKEGQTDRSEQASNISEEMHTLHCKPGRVPLHERHPRLVTAVLDFISLHGFAAESRRRTTVGNSMGGSLADIRKHVLQTFPEIKSISRSAIHLLMVTPRKGSINSRSYHGLVDARVPAKRNDKKRMHPDAHFCNAQVGLMNRDDRLFVLFSVLLPLGMDDF